MKKILLFVVLLAGCKNEMPTIETYSGEILAKSAASLPCLSDVSNVTIIDGCGNDPRNYLPMSELYVGSVGMPIIHRDHGLVAASLVKPIEGKIWMAAEGHSNALRVFAAFSGLLRASNLDNPALRFVNNAAGGMALENWVAGGVGMIDSRVQIVLLHHSMNKGFADCSQQTYADSTAFYLRARVLQLKVKYPMIKQIFFQSREFGGWKCYSSPGALAEPAGYFNGFGVKAFIDLQVSGSDSILSYANAPFLAWSFNPWQPTTPRNWFEGAGLHPCTTGASYWAQQWFDFLLNDSTTKTWFAAQ